MRKKQERSEGRQAVEDIDALYGLQGATLALLSQSANMAFRVDIPALSGSRARRYVLRLYGTEPRGYVGGADADTIRSEFAWLHALNREAGLVVPYPIPTKDGDLLAAFRAADGATQQAVLSAWVPGRFFSAGLTPLRIERVGAFMGRIHQHAASFAPPAGFMRPRWDAERLFGAGSVLDTTKLAAVYTAAERADFTALAQRAGDVMRTLGEHRAVFGLIHSDLHRNNYLFQGQEVHAIDFDECGFGYYLFYIAVTLADLRRRPSYASLHIAFLRSYRSTFTLTERDERYIDLFLMLRTVDLVNWIGSWPSPDDHPWARPYLADAVTTIRDFLANAR